MEHRRYGSGIIYGGDRSAVSEPGSPANVAARAPRGDLAAARIRVRVESIPRGFVSTYGDVWPAAPRLTGRVLRTAGDTLPWWRVVRSDGTLAKGARQAALLRAEGVTMRGGRVDMGRARLPSEVLHG